MRGGVVWLEENGLADQLDREVMASDLLRDDAKMVEGIGVLGLQGKNLTVKRLRVGQAPSLVVLERQCVGLWNRNRGHGGHSASKQTLGMPETQAGHRALCIAPASNEPGTAKMPNCRPGERQK